MNHPENIHVQEVNEHDLQGQAETLTDMLPVIEEEALEEVMGAAGNLKAIIYSASGKERDIADHSAPPSPNPQNPGIFGTAPSLLRSFSAPTILTGRWEHYQRKMDMDLDSRRYGDYAAPPRPL